MKTKPNADAALRQRAEAQFKARPAAANPPDTAAAALRLMQELEIHQIELEMQNDELRAAQAEIQAGLERYTELFDFAPAGYFTITADGTIRLVNLTGATWLGSERAHLIGKRLNVMVAEGDRKIFSDFLDRVFASSKNENCRVLLTPAGQSPLIVRLDAKRREEGDCCRVVMTDITERKQVEASHARLAMAVEQAAETIVITDAQGMILYANPAFEKTTGYTQAEALGQNPRVIKSGKHDAAFYRQMWKTLLQGEVWSGHFLNKRKDGAMYQEEATISPIRNDEGKITNFVAVKRDVSREVQLERQITEIQKMEAIGQLAGGVAHDYNNILAATNIQLGMLMMDKTLKPEVLEALKDLRRGSDRAASLTRQLLLFSRRQAMQIKPVELNTLLDDVLKMIRRVIGEHIDLNIQSQTQAAWIEADSGMIEQVVMNLAINARDAMPNGGKLTIRINELVISPQDIRNPEARTDHFISLTVADEGCGMSEEIQSRIFEPFFTTKGVGKGTGLGLATVYGIVKQHRGWIEVSSKIGKGSVFQVLLPKGGSQTSVTAEHTQPPIMDGTGTILVVEDEDSVRRPLVLFLKLAGYQVFEAENGAEALKLWGGRLNLINLLLTDMVMPGGMNGKQLADSFKKSKPDLPVIITSGYSTEISNFGFNEEYGFRFLAKPYQTNALLKIVQQCLGSKK